LSNVDFRDARFTGANFDGALFDHVHWGRAEFRGERPAIAALGFDERKFIDPPARVRGTAGVHRGG
jgi:uncharacterized protein YjbI with pentapeptide repeats